jgi:hypothetical protein
MNTNNSREGNSGTVTPGGSHFARPGMQQRTGPQAEVSNLQELSHS